MYKIKKISKTLIMLNSLTIYKEIILDSKDVKDIELHKSNISVNFIEGGPRKSRKIKNRKKGDIC